MVGWQWLVVATSDGIFRGLLTYLQVIFVAECSPPNTDYMQGKQGLLKGRVPRAFLEMLED